MQIPAYELFCRKLNVVDVSGGSGAAFTTNFGSGLGFALTLTLRYRSSSTLLGFRSRWRRAGERLWRKFIPSATWWASLKASGSGGTPSKVFCAQNVRNKGSWVHTVFLLYRYRWRWI